MRLRNRGNTDAQLVSCASDVSLVIDNSFDRSEAIYSLKEVKRQVKEAKRKNESAPHIYRIVNEHFRPMN